MEVDQSLLDSLPQEQRHQLARRMRQEQIRRYYERDNASPAPQRQQVRPAGRRRVAFRPRDKLRDAMQRRDQEEVRNVLHEQLASPDTTSEATGASLLHQCCLDNNIMGAQLLMEFGANLDLQDHDRWTPLHMAAACGSTEMVKFLLENNADCTLLDVDGNFAYDNAEEEEIRALLLKHMMFNGIYEQDMKSIRSRMAKAMLAAVKECISRNWNLNRLNKNGVSLLHISAANGYHQIARLLIDAGAEVDVIDDAGYTPLHVAAKFGQVKLVKLLLQRRADPRAKSFKLELPINITDSDTITEFLRKAGGEGTLQHQGPDQSLPFSQDKLNSVSIDLDEFENARAKSRSLNRDIPISKLEKLFEAETLSERDSYDVGSDDSTQGPALNRLRRSMKAKGDDQKVELPDAASTDNLATLSDLDEGIILQYLRERYHCDQIYTYIGEILVAVNPFKQLPYYTDVVSNQYSGSHRDPNTLPPHIFAVASQVYQDMLAERRPQCCIISGESGAGKTESCKFIVQHILHVTNSVENEINLKIEQVNPVLEAFGNAQTVMNNNSSRFGKFLELVFNNDGLVLGANFREYLLEKSRVVFHGKGERNFHIFYLMFAGLSLDEKASLHLGEPEEHRCLVGSGTALEGAVTPTMAERFREIQDSLQAIGFSKEDEQSLLQAMAGVLHICDVSFSPNGEGSAITNPHKVELVSGLLLVDLQELSSCLVQEVTVTRGEQILRNRTVVQANDCRDALAKALYGRMFGWIVNGINHHLQADDVNHTTPNSSLKIGVLDIFGFENFEKNSFEQLCINVANEQLQHHFNEHIFRWEQEECAKEGVTMETISYCSNWPVVDLFLEKNLGLLALIDEESRFPRASDQSLATKLHNTHSNNTIGMYMAPPDGRTTFGISHYAGHVQYDMTGFLDKNRDTLPPSIIFLMKASGNLMIREVFGAKMTRTGSVAPSVRQKMSRKAVSPFSFFNRKASRKLTMGKNLSRKKAAAHKSSVPKGDSGRRGPPTVANYFKNSLSELMEKMNAATPHFIRCLKPNNFKEPNNLMDDYIVSQLKYTGIFETIRIRQCGFPTRLTFEDFLKRYQTLHDFYVPDSIPTEQAACQLLERAGVKGWECGRTKVFLKFYNLQKLKECCRDVRGKVIVVQKCIRQWLARKKMIKLAEARQRQALAVQNLLAMISKSGVHFHAALQLTNEVDIMRFEEKCKQEEPLDVASTEQNTSLAETIVLSMEQQQPTIPVHQGREGNYVNASTSAGKVSTARQMPMCSTANHSSSSRPDEFLLQTSAQDDECREEIYEDVITQPVVRQVQRIQSVHIGGDDFIPLTTASQLVIHQGGESDELYENFAGMKQLPAYQNGDEIYDDAASLQQHPPDIYDDTASLMQNPPEEIYDNAASLRQNQPDEIYDDTASLMQNPPDEIYNDPATLMQNPPVSANASMLSPTHRARTSSPTPPPIPPRSPTTVITTLTRNGCRERSLSSPAPPIPARSPATRLSSNHLSHLPYMPEDSTISYGTQLEAPPIPPRSPDTKLTAAQHSRRQTPPQIGGDETPPLPPRKESLSHAEKPFQVPRRKSAESIPNPRADKPMVTNLPSNSFQKRLSNLYEGGSPAHTPPAQVRQQPRQRILSEPAIPVLPAEAQHVFSNSALGKCQPYEEVLPLRTLRQQVTPSPPVGMSQNVIPAAQGWTSSEPIAEHSVHPQAIPSHSHPPAITSNQTSQTPKLISSDVPVLQAPPMGHPFNPQNARPQHVPPTLGQSSYSAAQNVPLAPPAPPPPLVGGRAGAPVPPPPFPIVDTTAVPAARPPPSVSVPQPPIPPLPPTPPTGHPFNPLAQVAPPAPPPPPTPPTGHPFNRLAQAAPPAPPPPPTPPTGHPFNPLVQAAPPAPPPPAIGRVRPKVPSTDHQPMAGGVKLISKVPPSPPGMADLLAGLSDVQLKKVSDRSLPEQRKSVDVSGSTSLTASLMVEMQSFQLKKSPGPNKRYSMDVVSCSGHSDGSAVDAVMQLQSFQLKKSPGPNKRYSMDVGSYSEQSDGSAADLVQSLPPSLISPPAYKSPTSPGSPGKAKVPPPPVCPKPNARKWSESSPAQPPSPLVTSPVTMAVTQPVIPEWKRALQEKKHKELAAKEAAQGKWEGVPEWKRKLLEEKENKAAEAKEEMERKAKLEAMPAWKRNLIKKQEQ